VLDQVGGGGEHALEPQARKVELLLVWPATAVATSSANPGPEATVSSVEIVVNLPEAVATCL
jgi:hypothetical protein